MKSKDQFTIRAPKPTDLYFILNSFCTSMKSESLLGKSCPSDIFYPNFHQVVDNILENADVLIAADTETDTILGYLIYKNEVIYYTYVKLIYRRLHVAKDLIEHAMQDHKSIMYCLQTKASKEIQEKYPEFIYNPFILYKKGIT